MDVIASKGAKGRWVLDAPELRIKELLETIAQATPFLNAQAQEPVSTAVTEVITLRRMY